MTTNVITENTADSCDLSEAQNPNDVICSASRSLGETSINSLLEPTDGENHRDEWLTPVPAWPLGIPASDAQTAIGTGVLDHLDGLATDGDSRCSLPRSRSNARPVSASLNEWELPVLLTPEQLTRFVLQVDHDEAHLAHLRRHGGLPYVQFQHRRQRIYRYPREAVIDWLKSRTHNLPAASARK